MTESTDAVPVGVVLVPGACHGGWWYEPLAAELELQGIAAAPVTLAGLGAQDDGTTAVTLDDHIDHVRVVVAAMRRRAGRVVLVGHSYAGSVITAVADHAPHHVDALVYLDAFVPEDGDSCYSMTTDEQRHWYIDGAGPTGLAVEPLPFFDSRARPHPLGTLIQKSRLTGAWRSVPARHYVYATEWAGESPFAATTQRILSEPGWTVHEWATRHNVMHDGTDRVRHLLVAVAASLEKRD